MSQTTLTKVAINRETAWGTAGTTYFLLPIQPPSVSDNYEQILDQGLRGVAAKDFGAQQGCGIAEFSMEGVWYPEEMGYLVYGILGGTACAATASPGTWTMTLADQCPTFTLLDYPKIGTPGSTAEIYGYTYGGMLLNSLTIRFNAGEGAVGWSAAFTGKTAGTVDATGITIIGTPNPPLLGWYGSVDIGTYGAEVAYTKLVEAEITFTREVVLQPTAQNTKTASFGYHGPLEVTMTATSEFQTVADYIKYQNHTGEAVKFTLARGSGTAHKSLEIYIPHVSYLESPMEFDRSAVNVKLGWGCRGLYDQYLTDKLVRVKLVNSWNSSGTPYPT